MAGHWTHRDAITSDRVKQAIAFGDTLADVVNGTREKNFDVLLPMIDPARFLRTGNERHRQMDWPTYRAMLEQWDGGSGQYEKHLYRASEAGNVVYLDLDEFSTGKDGAKTALRSISIYEFDESDRIVAVDVCMGFHGAAFG